MTTFFQPLRLKPVALGLAAAIMFGSVAVAEHLKPDAYWADHTGEPDYEQVVPMRFGDWQALPSASRSVVNPVQEEALRRIYSQTFARNFLHMPTGRVVMLSIAYGRDQSNDTQLHTPEQCYPSQGFKVTEAGAHDVATDFGVVKAMRVRTTLGTSRVEPLTYFIRVGEAVARGSRERNVERIKLAMRGYLVDGTLVRVSEITMRDDPFDLQDRFIQDLLKATDAQQRGYLIGGRESAAPAS